MGRLKNRNKNPVAEKAIQELELELKRECPEGGPVSSTVLSLVTATLNKRVRNRGLSAKEILLQRDGFTGEHLNINDDLLAENQKALREQDHGASACSQAKIKRPVAKSTVDVGELIFLKGDGDKHTARDKYIVTSTEEDCLYAQKLVGSQFRSKCYKLLYSEIYPVPTKSDLPTLPVLHQHELESSDDSDMVEAPNYEHIRTRSPIREPSDHNVRDAPLAHEAAADHPPIQLVPQADNVPLLRPPPVPPDLPGRHSSGSSDSNDQDNSVQSVDYDLDQHLNLRRPRRRARLPAALKDYVLHTPSDSSDE